MDVGSLRRRRPWYLATVGGVASVSGLAAFTIVTASPPAADNLALARYEQHSLRPTQPPRSTPHARVASEDARTSLVADNGAHNEGGWALSASAIVAGSGATTTPDRNVVVDNVGGGVGNSASALYVWDSIIRRSHTEGLGGGIFNAEGQVVVDNSRISENSTTLDGAGFLNVRGEASIRRSVVDLNLAIGADSRGAGLVNEDGRVTLTDTRLAENLATNGPGGVFSTNADVDGDDESEITRNRPTNCTGSDQPIPNCFG